MRELNIDSRNILISLHLEKNELAQAEACVQIHSSSSNVFEFLEKSVLRIWESVKSIFGASCWQKTSKTIQERFFTTLSNDGSVNRLKQNFSSLSSDDVEARLKSRLMAQVQRVLTVCCFFASHTSTSTCTSTVTSLTSLGYSFNHLRRKILHLENL